MLRDLLIRLMRCEVELNEVDVMLSLSHSEWMKVWTETALMRRYRWMWE